MGGVNAKEGGISTLKVEGAKMGGLAMGGMTMGEGISTLKMGGVTNAGVTIGGVTIEVVTMGGGSAMGGMIMGGGISTLTMGGVAIGGVSIRGVNGTGFKAPILKRVIVVGLILGVVTGVSVATGEGMSNVGGVCGGLGGV